MRLIALLFLLLMVVACRTDVAPSAAMSTADPAVAPTQVVVAPRATHAPSSPTPVPPSPRPTLTQISPR